MVNSKIRLIMFFIARDGEALYNQQKQDRELTVAQVVNSLLQNSTKDWRMTWKEFTRQWSSTLQTGIVLLEGFFEF